MEFFHKVPKLRFMAFRKLCYGFSALIVLASLVALYVHGLNLAVDFTGGVVAEASFASTANLDAARQALKSAGFNEVQVQNFG
jgi:preprotein translocase subunit SecF